VVRIHYGVNVSLVDATGVKVLLETEADHTGSNPVLTTK